MLKKRIGALGIGIVLAAGSLAACTQPSVDPQPATAAAGSAAMEMEADMNLEEYLYETVLPVIMEWEEEGIYAISFFVYSNQSNLYNGFSNFPEFSIGYNTEEDCDYASELSEERWNFAFWRQDMTEIIEPDSENEGANFLFAWYKENGIDNIGYEDEQNSYDSNMNYIGKGPSGYYELLCAVSNVARRLQMEGKVKEKFGTIPIIVHDLEYAWYVNEATENANPNGEAENFLKSLENSFKN